MTKSKETINFIPKPKHFLVAADNAKETAGGLYIPDSAKDLTAQVLFSEPQLALCIGPDCEFVKLEDWVLLEPSPVDLIEVDGKGYFLIADYRVRGKVLNYTPKKKENGKSKIELL